MKNLFYTAALLPFLAVTATAGDIAVSVSELVQKENAFPEQCYVVMQVENASDDTINLTIELGAEYEEGSATAMIAPAGNAFGSKDVLRYENLAPQSVVTEKEALLGVTCTEITSIAIRPSCENLSTPGADCQGAVLRSANSIIPLGTEDDATLIGGLPDTSPKGPIHGQWIIANESGEAMFTLNITQPLDESGSGSFSSHPALCAVVGEPEDCAQGQISDKELRYVSQSDDKVLIQAHASPEGVDKFNLIWSLSAGEGKLGNSNSANLAPFTASKAE